MGKIAALVISLIACFLLSQVTPTEQVAATNSVFFPADASCVENQIICTILLIFNWLAIGVGTVVVIMVIVGAIQYMTASGSQDQAKKGIKTIRNAIVALLLYLVMWALLNFLVPGGMFG